MLRVGTMQTAQLHSSKRIGAHIKSYDIHDTSHPTNVLKLFFEKHWPVNNYLLTINVKIHFLLHPLWKNYGWCSWSIKSDHPLLYLREGINNTITISVHAMKIPGETVKPLFNQGRKKNRVHNTESETENTCLSDVFFLCVIYNCTFLLSYAFRMIFQNF